MLLPLKPCAHQPCPNLVESGRCHAHTKTNRGPDDKFYTSRQWRATRLEHLRIEPLCRECRKVGFIAAGEMVDHIVRIRDGGAPYDHANLQTMCNRCHAVKRAMESRK